MTDTADRPSSRVRVVSYNIRALKDDREALLRVIRTLQPDVLCLQEVPRHPLSSHRVAGLAQQLGLTWTGGHRHGMSTTLLTSLRLDVLDSGHRALPIPRGQEPRGYCHALLRLPGYAPFTAVSVHLSLKAAQRGEHARLMREAAEVGYGGPLVLAGDINETATGGAWGLLADGMDDVTGELFSFPAHAPQKRIDAIFSSPQLQATRPAVELDGRDLRRATDHLPLWVDLDLSALRSAVDPTCATG